MQEEGVRSSGTEGVESYGLHVGPETQTQFVRLSNQIPFYYPLCYLTNPISPVSKIYIYHILYILKHILEYILPHSGGARL